MKKIYRNGIAIVCASILGAAGLFAQDANGELAEPVEVAVETSAQKAQEGYISLNRSDYTISLHQSDYDGGFPSLWVNFPSDYEGTRKIKWSSSDMKIVKVDQVGRLFPNKLGEAVITATTKDGKYSASCKVNITKYGPRPTSEGFKITTDLCGDASVTFGTDLDTGKSGFCTDQNIKLKMDILNLGEVWAGDEEIPIWGEIRIFTKGDPIRYMVDSDSGTDPYWNNWDFEIVVDRAKIHMGDAYITLYDRTESSLGYINYTTGPDVAYSFISVDTNRRYGQLTKQTLQAYLNSFDKDDRVYGFSGGYEMDGVFKVQGDIASTMKWVAGAENTAEDTADPSNNATDWLYKLTAEFTMIPGLNVQAGYSNGILGSDSVYRQDMRFGLQASYQWDMFDIYYLKPKFGMTMIQSEGRGNIYPLMTAGVLLGWEDKQHAFDYWSSTTRYDEDDYGSYPGLALAVQYADAKLAEYCTSFRFANNMNVINNDLLILHGSFSTGNGLLIENLEAVGAIDIINALSDQCVIGGTAGVKYWYPFNHRTNICGKAFVTGYHDKFNSDNDYLYIKTGVELCYQRIGISIDYSSNDLIHGFNDGEAYNRLGKLETTFKVWF